MLRDKLKKVTYEFVRKVLNLPSARIIANYDSIGSNKEDRVLYSVLKSMEKEFELEDGADDWKRMFSLTFDACYVSNKVSFNCHTNKLFGFSADTFDMEVLAADLKQLGSAENDSKVTLDLSNKRAKQYLLFMVSRW